MSLFGDSPPGESPPPSRSRTLFSDDDAAKSSSLFDDGDDGTSSPWDAPTPRRKSRADLVRSLLRPSDVPASYIEVFDKVLEEDDGASLGKVGPAGVRRVFASARVSAEMRDEILGIVGAGDGGEIGRNEFNVLLALVALAQEGERPSLDAVDERRGGEFSIFCLPLSFLPCCYYLWELEELWLRSAAPLQVSLLSLASIPAGQKRYHRHLGASSDWLFTFVLSSCRIASAVQCSNLRGFWTLSFPA